MGNSKNSQQPIPSEQLKLWTDEVFKKLEDQGRKIVAVSVAGRSPRVHVPRERK